MIDWMPMRSIKRLLCCALLCASAVIAAADDYPSKPIRLTDATRWTKIICDVGIEPQ
jgi:hypothetical protein